MFDYQIRCRDVEKNMKNKSILVLHGRGSYLRNLRLLVIGICQNIIRSFSFSLDDLYKRIKIYLGISILFRIFTELN